MKINMSETSFEMWVYTTARNTTIWCQRWSFQMNNVNGQIKDYGKS